MGKKQITAHTDAYGHEQTAVREDGKFSDKPAAGAAAGEVALDSGFAAEAGRAAVRHFPVVLGGKAGIEVSNGYRIEEQLAEYTEAFPEIVEEFEARGGTAEEFGRGFAHALMFDWPAFQRLDGMAGDNFGWYADDLVCDAIYIAEPLLSEDGSHVGFGSSRRWSINRQDAASEALDEAIAEGPGACLRLRREHLESLSSADRRRLLEHDGLPLYAEAFPRKTSDSSGTSDVQGAFRMADGTRADLRIRFVASFDENGAFVERRLSANFDGRPVKAEPTRVRHASYEEAEIAAEHGDSRQRSGSPEDWIALQSARRAQ